MRLSEMMHIPEWEHLAGHSVQAFAQALNEHPHSLPQMLVAFMATQDRAVQVVIAGDRGDERTRALLRVVHERFIANKVLLLADDAARAELQRQFPDARRYYIMDKGTEFKNDGIALKLRQEGDFIAEYLDRLSRVSNKAGQDIIKQMTAQIDKALEARRLRVENRRLSIERALGFRMIGESPPMKRLISSARVTFSSQCNGFSFWLPPPWRLGRMYRRPRVSRASTFTMAGTRVSRKKAGALLTEPPCWLSPSSAEREYCDRSWMFHCVPIT